MALQRDIVDGIYAAALDAQLWPDAVRRIGQAVNAQGVALMLADENLISRNLTLTCGLIDQQSVRNDYRDYFGAIDPAVALFTGMKIGEATTTSMAWAPRAIQRNEFYNDFYTRLTLRDSMGSPLLRREGCTAFLSVHRDKDQLLFDQADLGLFRRYMGHMRKALMVHRQIVHLRHRAETLEAVFDRMSLGVALADGLGRLQYVNRAAQAILARNDGLSESKGALVARHRQAAPKLARLIAAAAADATVDRDSTMSIQRNDKDEAYAVLVVPHRPLPQDNELFALVGNKADAIPRDSNLVLVLIRDTDTGARHGFAPLRRHFGLTGSEAELLEALAFGESLATYCARRGISINTAKFHLHHLFAKTEARNQSALVRIAVRFLGNFAPFSYH